MEKYATFAELESGITSSGESVEIPFPLTGANLPEFLGHFVEATRFTRIHLAVKAGSMAYPDPQRDFRPKLALRVVIN
jgi:hypothetical protein